MAEEKSNTAETVLTLAAYNLNDLIESMAKSLKEKPDADLLDAVNNTAYALNRIVGTMNAIAGK